MSGYPFDRDACNLFLQAMYAGQPGWINLCYVPYAGAQLRAGEFFPITPQGLEQAVDYAADLSRRSHYAIYLRTTTLKERPYGRGLAKDTLATPYGWADLDFGNDGHKGDDLPPTAEDAKGLVAEAGMPEPTLWIFSGGGWYPIWLWNRALPYDEAKELVARIQNLLLLASKLHGWNYGTGVKDMARVLRLVGSSNMKMGHSNPRACRIDGGTGRPVDPAAFPPAPTPEVVRKADPKAAPPPKKTSGPYDPNAPRKPWDVFDELVDWPEILEGFGLSYVRSDDYGDQYVRDGATSTFSLKVMHQTNSVVNFSDALDLPVGVGLTKAAVLSYMTGYAGDRGNLLRDLLAGINPAAVPQHVLDEMAAVGAQSTTFMGITIVHPPEQGAPVQRDDDLLATDQDIDDFIATFTRHTRPRAMVVRERRIAADGPTSLARHTNWLVHEAMLGLYPAEHAVRALVAACLSHGVDPKPLLKTALAAILNAKVTA